MALAVLYDRYGAMVYSVVNRILKDLPAAQEVLQDIFHQFWRRARGPDPSRGTLAGWLLVIARNRDIDRLRRQRREEVDALGEDRVSLPFNLESRVARQELMEKLQATLAELPRLSVRLWSWHTRGLTHTETAEHTRELSVPLRRACGRLCRR